MSRRETGIEHEIIVRLNQLKFGSVALPEAIPEELDKWCGIAELLLTQKGDFRKKVDKRQGFPPGDKAKKDTMHAVLQVLADDVELARSLHGIPSLPPK